MTHSMTGYAQAERAGGDLRVAVTARSVNHRFLDLKLRLPPEADPFEPEIRRRIKRKIERGSVRVNVDMESAAPAAVRVDQALVAAYLDAHRALAEANGIAAEPDLNAVLKLPGAVAVERPSCGEDALKTLLLDALDEALDRLNEARIEEGRAIAADIRARAEAAAGEIDALRGKTAAVNGLYFERLQARLGELLADSKIDDQRLLREAAVMAERTDISEELQRLDAHAAKLQRMLHENTAGGKNIDFLAQEMNREANTLLSKTNPLGADALPITEAGLRLKAEIEKIREQAQNVE